MGLPKRKTSLENGVKERRYTENDIYTDNYNVYIAKEVQRAGVKSLRFIDVKSFVLSDGFAGTKSERGELVIRLLQNSILKKREGSSINSFKNNRIIHHTIYKVKRIVSQDSPPPPPEPSKPKREKRK